MAYELATAMLVGNDHLILSGKITRVGDELGGRRELSVRDLTAFPTTDTIYDFSGMLGGSITFTPQAENIRRVLEQKAGAASGLYATFGQRSDPTVIPEPTSMALLGIGLGVLLVHRRRLGKPATA